MGLYITLILVALTPWLINAYWIVTHLNDVVTGLFLFKLIGLVPPFQFITVWF